MTTESQKRASEKYCRKFVQIRTRITPEEKEALERKLAECGMSENAFIRELIRNNTGMNAASEG